MGRGGQAASGVVPDDPVPVLCTVTNTRTSATLGAAEGVGERGHAGDIADLSIDGATSGPRFATATVPAGGTGLSIDKATVTLLSGDTVDLAEQLGAGNAGSYTLADHLQPTGPDPGRRRAGRLLPGARRSRAGDLHDHQHPHLGRH